MTFLNLIAGARFKIVNEATGDYVASYHTRPEAIGAADHLKAETGVHHLVYSIEFCGGSKTLADLERGA